MTTTKPSVNVDDSARSRWEADYAQQVPRDVHMSNRSGIPIRPLYTAEDRQGTRDAGNLPFPGEFPFTRGIYSSMYRGRTWTQRQLVGLGTPEDYNRRLQEVLAQGASAVSLLPCNSVFRGYDMDEVHTELLGTCGTVINHAGHMDTALAAVDIERTSIALNDPSPFTLLAFLIAVARRRGVALESITGTSNQSDYLSHFVANHMFYRLALAGARRLLVDQIEYCRELLPRWNPVSIVGQHMQQAGATPAEAMAFTLSSALQYAQDCRARGLDPDQFLPRFTYFFDVSISFFEEIAKFRAGRRIWARLTRERLSAKDPRSWRFKFHAQTSGVDLTRQQPLLNVARVAIQAMAGIFGGLQSLHTDAFDEALSCPTPAGARIAVNTQNILRGEAHLTDVIDPLGGSFYVETLTDQMEAEILRVMRIIEDAGGMYSAVEHGLVQRMIGQSAQRFQERLDNKEEMVVGVTTYQAEEDHVHRALDKPDPARMQAHIAAFQAFKRERSQDSVKRALESLARASHERSTNLFAAVVTAAEAGCTHGEICARLREELGFGHPLVVA